MMKIGAVLFCLGALWIVGVAVATAFLRNFWLGTLVLAAVVTVLGLVLVRFGDEDY